MKPPRHRVTDPRWSVALLLAAHGGCATDEPASSARSTAPLYATPGCDGGGAPFRTSDGEHTCTAVGAGGTAAGGEWAEAPTDVAPVVYVRGGATAPGDGSRRAPYGDLARALAHVPAPATILVARGLVAVEGGVAVRRGLTLRGAGAELTVLEATGAAPILEVGAEDEALEVTVEGMTLRHRIRPGAEVRRGALEASGVGARLTLRDVVVERAAFGVAATRDATLCLERVTLRTTTLRGLSLTAGAHGYLRSVLVRDGDAVGIWSERAHLVAASSMVTAQGRDGVVLRGARGAGACVTDADCPPEPGCLGLSHERVCAPDRDAAGARRCRSVTVLTDVVALGNQVTGVRAERSFPTAEEVAAGARLSVLAQPGPIVRGARLVLAGTGVPAGAVGGDGLYVAATASVSLDEDIASDRRRGRGSEFVGNARTGVLVDGERVSADPSLVVPSSLEAPGRLVVAGALLASNVGPGMFAQGRAEVPRFAFSEVSDNGALGLGVTTGARVASIQCNRFVYTRAGTLRFTDPALRPLAAADGASFADDGRGAVELVDTELSENARFGLVSAGVVLRLRGSTRGSGNGFGVGLRGVAAVVEGTADAVTGRAPAPMTFEVTRGDLASVAR